MVVKGQGKIGDICKYSINIMDNQQNYYILQENKVVNDYSSSGYYRYYQFSLANDDKVKNVTFTLNTIHGDADIYVSRKNPYPSKNDFEKSSAKPGLDPDFVYFDDKQAGNSVYQIGVFSLEYSTYTLVVKVDRGDLKSRHLIELQEGIGHQGSIHNED